MCTTDSSNLAVCMIFKWNVVVGLDSCHMMWSCIIYRQRQHGGVRIQWGFTEPSFFQRWNPLCDDLGYVTLTHHLLAYKPEERETSMYDAGDFIDSAIATKNKTQVGSLMTCENGPITIESYGSVMSMVFNQSHIGFNLARGGVSYWLWAVCLVFCFRLYLFFYFLHVVLLVDTMLDSFQICHIYITYCRYVCMA